MSEKLDKKLYDKIIGYFIIIAILKIVYMIFFSSGIQDFILGLLFFVVAFIILGVIVSYLLDNDVGGSYRGGSGSVYLDNEKFNVLRKRYQKLSDDFVNKKEFKKAAYVQMKLLQNPYQAANILKDGEYYSEAAYVFLKKCRNKPEAANCYKQARNYNKAIELYKEIEMHEDVGDLYKELNNKEKADKHFQIVKENHLKNNNFYQAHLLTKNKIENKEEAKEYLLKGWNKNHHAELCLSTYFNENKTDESLKEAINYIYDNQLAIHKRIKFLNVLKKLKSENKNISEFVQNLVYEMISKNKYDKDLVSYLSEFVREDNKIHKDISNYRKL